MTGINTHEGASSSGETTVSHRKGHRRQESMYAMTGLYSESVPENENCDDDTTQVPSTTNFCHDNVVIKCHSRNPSAGFDRCVAYYLHKSLSI